MSSSSIGTISSSTVADNNLLVDSSSPTVDRLVNSSPPKFPVKLNDRVERNTVGQNILKAILLHARSNGGYHNCFGFGNKGPLLEGDAKVLFKSDGRLNK